MRASSRLCALTVLAILAGGPAAAGEDSERAVVLELFTSQGCSSCPPADRLLSRLAREEGLRVVPLAFHVDYWNYIGWTDPFSSSAWSERQRGYARTFESSRVYTPQLVVDGRADCVGSDEDCVRRRIARIAGAEPAGEVTLALEPGAGRLAIEITARVRRPASGERWNVRVAVFEKDLSTAVSKVENGGRTLHNDNAVRVLTEAFTVPARSGAEGSESLDLELDESWHRRNLGVAAFLQDPTTLEIHGVAVRYLSR